MFIKKNILKLVFQVFWVLFLFLSFSNSFAKIVISEIFPNTIDDKNLEYVKLKNIWNNEVFLKNWYLQDKSWKKYIFGNEEKLNILEEKIFLRTETKIILNNSSEEIFLYNNLWNLEDNIFYKTSKKGEKIIFYNSSAKKNEKNFETDEKKIEVDEKFLEEIGEVFDKKNIKYKNLEKIECEKYLKEKNIWEIFWEINNWDLDILEKDYIEKCWKIDFLETKEKIKLPKIILEFQRPSYILDLEKLEEKKFFKFEEKSLSLEFSLPDREKEAAKREIKEFFCDKKKKDCKINFNLEKSFSWSFLEKNYFCEITFWEEKIEKCNPNTIIFWEWKTQVNFKIIDKNNIKNFIENKIVVVNEKENLEEKKALSPESSLPWGEKGATEKKINISNPKIIIQSGLDEKKICKSKKCSINLTYKQENKREKCVWDFWNWISKNSENKNKCNPSYVSFEQKWNFKIKLKVYDEFDKNNFKESFLYFENKEKNKKSSKELTKSLSLEFSLPDREKEAAKKNWKNGEFYIFLQWKLKKNILWERWKINIFTKKNGEKVNFWLKFENLQKLRKVRYEWRFKNKKTFYRKNPKTHFFPVWKHFIIVRAKYKWKIIASDFLVLNIIKKKPLSPVSSLPFGEKGATKGNIKKLKLKKLKQKKLKLKEIKIKNAKKLKYKKIKKEKVLKSKEKILKEKNKKQTKNYEKKLEKIKNTNFKIILQGKKSKSKILKNKKIVCYVKKEICKINLWLEKFKTIRGLKYVWKFPNQVIIKKKNPKSMDFKLGNYSVFLDILYEWKIIKTEKINISVIKKQKKRKKKKGTKKVKNNEKEFFIKTVNAWYNEKIVKKEKWFFYGFWYLFIGFFLIYTIFIILKKEGFLEEEK